MGEISDKLSKIMYPSIFRSLVECVPYINGYDSHPIYIASMFMIRLFSCPIDNPALKGKIGVRCSLQQSIVLLPLPNRLFLTLIQAHLHL